MDQSQESEPGSLDRLSDLPDSLILEILSLLSSSIRDVVRTTILSKRWKDLWTTVPRFKYDFRDEDPNFIRGALVQWKGAKILDFSLCFIHNDPPSSDIIDSLLLLAMEKQVEELTVDLKPSMSMEYYAPQRLYSCSSITRLCLSYCSVQIKENVQWNQLVSLTLEHVDSVKVSSVTMSQILSGAPRLEQLILWPLEVNEDFYIVSTSLKFLEIGLGDYNHSVVYEILGIWAPNLLFLEFSGDIYGICFLDVPSLTHARLDFIDEPPPLETFDYLLWSIRHVTDLTLSDVGIQLLHEMKEKDMFVQFSNVTFLNVTTSKVEKMLNVLDMFPQLVTLYAELDELGSNMDQEFDEANATFSTSSLLHLKTVHIAWYLCDALILPFLKIILENARVLEEIVFRWKGNPEMLPGLPDLWESYQTTDLIFI
ncbi:F-box/LRR-repeat protein At3g26922-like [Salvia miltiorrhiza]|uniref:F-box/LRR-repeat protein At3g26922-like n=1 Tax=Salvia miltiorrhiza TaxID=226208 RepID=UPI0025AD121A|nr:F-box/LRR-repeat protein At3g26922-like [Salvia miltiorrhiza]